MKAVLIIPARYKSSRFPGKPLIDLAGKTMIQRVWSQCIKAIDKSQVYIATEDERILLHCKENGMQCILTTDNCLTGTDRVAEVARQIEADYYINVQGDEPVINPEDIRKVIDLLPNSKGSILNGYCEIDCAYDYNSISVPKVVMRGDERLLYMSRAAIPGNKLNKFNLGYRQVCIYAFPKIALEAFSKCLTKTPLEEEEDIEILRFLEMGYEVQMVKMSKDSIPVDHPEDVKKVLERLKVSKPYKTILWDFDGVIMDSMAVRDKGFELVLQDYPREQVASLMTYHQNNGGLSRYHKFRYFFEEIRKETISESQIQILAAAFSKVMLKNLIDSNLLINDSLQFIKENHKKYSFHIVSGSDQEELRFICQALNIAVYFKSIHGSPTPKNDLVAQLIKSNNYTLENCVLIGDSINDYEAAKVNDIHFYGFNNKILKELDLNYIETFMRFDFNYLESI